MLIVGERINVSRKAVRDALERLDSGFIQREALSQAKAGADYIDINGGTFPGREAEMLTWPAEVVQEVTDLPLCLDSSDPEALATVLPKVRTPRPMINSIMLEAGRFDPMTFPLATGPGCGKAAIGPISGIIESLPGIHTICGMTNVSHGLPARMLVNRTFLVCAMASGLDSAILDPTDQLLMGSIIAAEAVLGIDEYCINLIEAFQSGRLARNRVLKVAAHI